MPSAWFPAKKVLEMRRKHESSNEGSEHAPASPPYPVGCTIEAMRVKIPANVRAALTEIARMFGRQGGKASARNMTPEERSARAKKASLAAAEVRTAKRLAREGLERDRKAAKRKRPGRAR